MNGCTRNGNAGAGTWRPGDAPVGRLRAPTTGQEARSANLALRDVWPHLRELVLPRRKILAVGFLLMIVNRLSGLVLPSPRDT